jgi:hypothetical protein
MYKGRTQKKSERLSQRKDTLLKKAYKIAEFCEVNGRERKEEGKRRPLYV